VVSPTLESWSFGYDAFDRRIRVSGPEGTRWFIYDGDSVQAVYDDSGELASRFVTGLDFGEVLGEISGAALSYAVRDSLGTPVAWVSDAGGVRAEEWDAYGRRSSPTYEVKPYGFTGHAEDPSGLTWARYRYLEPEAGGWISEDYLLDTQRYGYANGSPLDRSDPMGLVEGIEDYKLRVQAACNGENTGKYYGSMVASTNGTTTGAVKATTDVLSRARARALRGAGRDLHHLVPQRMGRAALADIRGEININAAMNLIALDRDCHHALHRGQGSQGNYVQLINEAYGNANNNAEAALGRVVEFLLRGTPL